MYSNLAWLSFVLSDLSGLKSPSLPLLVKPKFSSRTVLCTFEIFSAKAGIWVFSYQIMSQSQYHLLICFLYYYSWMEIPLGSWMKKPQGTELGLPGGLDGGACGEVGPPPLWAAQEPSVRPGPFSQGARADRRDAAGRGDLQKPRRAGSRKMWTRGRLRKGGTQALRPSRPHDWKKWKSGVFSLYPRPHHQSELPFQSLRLWHEVSWGAWRVGTVLLTSGQFFR